MSKQTKLTDFLRSKKPSLCPDTSKVVRGFLPSKDAAFIEQRLKYLLSATLSAQDCTGRDNERGIEWFEFCSGYMSVSIGVRYRAQTLWAPTKHRQLSEFVRFDCYDELGFNHFAGIDIRFEFELDVAKSLMLIAYDIEMLCHKFKQRWLSAYEKRATQSRALVDRHTLLSNDASCFAGCTLPQMPPFTYIDRRVYSDIWTPPYDMQLGIMDSVAALSVNEQGHTELLDYFGELIISFTNDTKTYCWLMNKMRDVNRVFVGVINQQ